LPDERQILLKIPRKDNMYSFDMKTIIPKESLTCLVRKATLDESILWHRRLGHINFKNINKLVKDNLVRGFPKKHFENNQTCVAYLKGKQHRASYNLGKFDGKSDEGFFVGYSLSSKAFRVYNTRTIAVGTILDEYVGTQGDLNACTSTGKEATSQDYIVKDGPHNEDDDKDKSKDDSSPKEVNVVGQHVNAGNLEVNTCHFELNTVEPSLNTTSSSDLHSPKDMFKLGASDTLKATNIEPTSIAKALSDSSWVEAMQEELLNKKDKRGILIRNTASAFLYGTIEEVVYVTQPPRFKDPDHPNKVYKVVKGLYRLHQLQEHDEILKKLNYIDVKFVSTPVHLKNPLIKDGDTDDVDVHLYRSMIGSLMCLTASRLDIMFIGKSTTVGCKFLGNRLISWQCKKQTVVATSITEAKYVAVASLLTKGFDAGRFQYLVSSIGMLNP
ncbi:ribonuclease H-like domain-containing protein, partial [Tanacetum coccineum]